MTVNETEILEFLFYLFNYGKLTIINYEEYHTSTVYQYINGNKLVFVYQYGVIQLEKTIYNKIFDRYAHLKENEIKILVLEIIEYYFDIKSISNTLLYTYA